jgi:transcriptional regulator with XRE-family HTH domain
MLNPVIVGRIIHRYRKNKGITQEVLSGFAELNRVHLSQIERGERLPTLDTLFKIAYALNIKPQELVDAIEKETPEE